ncbi:MAG TPA: ABC transporter permease [Acidobacteriaceae bacterium]|nr:ABC transporter permease [Acidobacteriaceae bacterium]
MSDFIPPARDSSRSASTLILYARAFWGLMLRDFRVLRREVGPFAIRVAMNPLLFLFVFTYIFPRIGQSFGNASAGGAMNFGTVLLPGLMAVAIMFTGIAAVALPLSSEFGITREIDDRVMCPLPVAGVAIEKICFSALQSLLSAFIVFPLAYFIPDQPVHVHVSNYLLLGAVIVLASLVSGALGLTIGTSVEPRQIGLIFSVVVVPITFLGCVYYPWALLYHVRWLQYAVLLNPIVYMSEGLRAALTPALPHMPVWLISGALVVFLLLLGGAGIRGFLRRVIG